MKGFFKTYIFFLIVFLLFIACKKDGATNSGDYAFIGGEIINPNSDFLILSKFSSTLDTIMLDEYNRFLYKIEDIESGLYSFAHGGEYQLILLEPNDSIMFRINTMDFDESLVFTGNGAKKNNYLINMFLETEDENQKVLKYSQHLPNEFEAILDSIRDAKTKKLQAFNAKHGDSEMFLEIAQANIDYMYYDSKEIYPFAYYGNNELNNLESLPEDFYSYRKNVDYNNDIIKDYYPYYTFLRHHFDNMALSEHFSHSDEDHFNRNSLCYNSDKINLIDSLTTNQFIKDRLLYHYVIRYVNSSDNIESCDKLIKTFLSKSKNEKNKIHITLLTKALKNLKAGNDFPNIKVIDFNGSEESILSTINKPTVIYFWNYAMKGHFIESHKKVKELKAKYPEFNYVGININTENNIKNWKKTLKKYHLEIENEYQFANPGKAKEEIALNSITKVMVADAKGKIAISNGNLFAVSFEEELLGLINK